MLIFNTSCQYKYNNHYKIGQKIDSLNGVFVYYNGAVGNVVERNTSIDGYNIGLKYQCVEFVKRYYYEYLNHKMPNSYGHAKDFFDQSLADNTLNEARNLMQFTNGSIQKPQVNDIIIFDKTKFNPYGHVAIVASVDKNYITIIQQNTGKLASTRKKIKYYQKQHKYFLQSKHVLGWLRKII